MRLIPFYLLLGLCLSCPTTFAGTVRVSIDSDDEGVLREAVVRETFGQLSLELWGNSQKTKPVLTFASLPNQMTPTLIAVFQRALDGEDLIFSVPDSRGGRRNYRLHGISFKFREGILEKVLGGFMPLLGTSGEVPNFPTTEFRSTFGTLSGPFIEMIDLNAVEPAWSPELVFAEPRRQFLASDKQVSIAPRLTSKPLEYASYVRIVIDGEENGLHLSDLSLKDDPENLKGLDRELKPKPWCARTFTTSPFQWSRSRNLKVRAL